MGEVERSRRGLWQFLSSPTEHESSPPHAHSGLSLHIDPAFMYGTLWDISIVLGIVLFYGIWYGTTLWYLVWYLLCYFLMVLGMVIGIVLLVLAILAWYGIV